MVSWPWWCLAVRAVGSGALETQQCSLSMFFNQTGGNGSSARGVCACVWLTESHSSERAECKTPIRESLERGSPPLEGALRWRAAAAEQDGERGERERDKEQDKPWMTQYGCKNVITRNSRIHLVPQHLVILESVSTLINTALHSYEKIFHQRASMTLRDDKQILHRQFL